MVVDGGGKVGIGVTDPDSFLEVFGTTTQQKWSYDADSFATLTVADSSNTTLAVGETGTFTLDVPGNVTIDSDTGVITFSDGGASLATIATLRTESFVVACSDEDTVLTTGTAKAVFRLPYAFTVTSVRASLKTAGTTSGVTTIDINKDTTAGAVTPTSILTDKITIDYGKFTSTTAAAPPVLTTPGALPIADDAQITVDIDGLSGGASETGLKVTLIGYQTV
jgi:phage-related protein